MRAQFLSHRADPGIVARAEVDPSLAQHRQPSLWEAVW
jgi:hypothetical protein